MPRVHSLDERYRFLRESRPGVQLPERIMFIPWPKRIDSFEERGVWKRMLKRLADSGYTGNERDPGRLLDELRRLERAEAFAAVTGEGYKPLWERGRHRFS